MKESWTDRSPRLWAAARSPSKAMRAAAARDILTMAAKADLYENDIEPLFLENNQMHIELRVSLLSEHGVVTKLADRYPSNESLLREVAAINQLAKDFKLW